MDDPPDDAGTTTPDAAAPNASTPDASTPDAPVPDASTPDAPVPDASAPDGSMPDASTPDASTPDASTPDASMPDASTPDASTPDTGPGSQPALTDAHCDWIKQMCGKDPRDADQNGANPGGSTATDPDPSNQTVAPPDGSGSPIPGSSPDDAPASATTPADDTGGMTGVTPDGVGYSAPGTVPDGAQPAADAPDGGMTGVASDGAGYSAPGAAPDSSQPAQPAPDGGGGMTGVTPGGAPYSAPGSVPNASVDTEKAARETIAKDSTSGDPTTNADDVKLVNDEIVKSVPLKQLEALKAAGVKVVVTTGGVATFKPSLNDNLPRGHTDTFSTVAGVYLPDSKQVVIATHAGADGKRELPGQTESSSADVVAHEMAHAYNATGKDSDGDASLMSDQDDFKDAYKDETKTGHLSDPYYHQKHWWGSDSSGGRDEGFAESNAMYRTDPDGMKKTYPKLYAYWNKKLGQ